VRKLYEAGAVLTGKLATHEFAHGGPSFDLPWPPARNPWNREHLPAAPRAARDAAVAAGVLSRLRSAPTPAARSAAPAALCGIVGLKPTYGLVSRYGVYANSFSFDHAGPMNLDGRVTARSCCRRLPAPTRKTRPSGNAAGAKLPRCVVRKTSRGCASGWWRHLHEGDDCAVTSEVSAALEQGVCRAGVAGAPLSARLRLRPAQDYYDVKVTIAESELLAVHENALRTSAW